jgi:hypothetical protein
MNLEADIKRLNSSHLRAQKPELLRAKILVQRGSASRRNFCHSDRSGGISSCFIFLAYFGRNSERCLDFARQDKKSRASLNGEPTLQSLEFLVHGVERFALAHPPKGGTPNLKRGNNLHHSLAHFCVRQPSDSCLHVVFEMARLASRWNGASHG